MIILALRAIVCGQDVLRLNLDAIAATVALATSWAALIALAARLFPGVFLTG